MLRRSSHGALALAAALIATIGGARAADEAKYPSWKGQWNAIVTPGLEGRLSRVILLRSGSVPLPEDVYEYAVGHPVTVPWGFRRERVTLEIISENPGGTYDFVPHVLGVP